MDDIKVLYEQAKSSMSVSDVDRYHECIEMYLKERPDLYIAYLEYIISSLNGISSFDMYIEKYGIHPSEYDNIINVIESYIDECKKRNKNDNIYHECLDKIMEFRNKYIGCFLMYESHGGIENYKWTDIRNVNESINRIGIKCIPDIMISLRNNEKINVLYESLINNKIISDKILNEWLLECSKSFSIDNKIIEKINSQSLSGIVESNKLRRKMDKKRCMLLNESYVPLYSEDEINDIRNLISFKENLIDISGNMEAYKSIYEMHEYLDEIEENVFDMLPKSPTVGPILRKQMTGIKKIDEATSDKKTGRSPDYLAKNFDLKYGEDDKINHEDDEPSLDTYRRKPKVEIDDVDDIDTSDKSYDDDNEISSDDTISDDNKKLKGAVNNYYYYTYTNSFNKDKSNRIKYHNQKDDHSLHYNKSELTESVRISNGHMVAYTEDYNDIPPFFRNIIDKAAKLGILCLNKLVSNKSYPKYLPDKNSSGYKFLYSIVSEKTVQVEFTVKPPGKKDTGYYEYFFMTFGGFEPTDENDNTENTDYFDAMNDIARYVKENMNIPGITDIGLYDRGLDITFDQETRDKLFQYLINNNANKNKSIGESHEWSWMDNPFTEAHEDRFLYTYRVVKATDGNSYLITFDIDGPGVVNYKLHYPDATEKTVRFVPTLDGNYLRKYGNDNYVSKGNKIISIKNIKTGEMVDEISATGGVPVDGTDKVATNNLIYKVGDKSPLTYKSTVPVYPIAGDVKTPFGAMKGLDFSPTSSALNPFMKRRIDFSKPILYKDEYIQFGPLLKSAMLYFKNKLSSYKKLSLAAIERMIDKRIKNNSLYDEYKIAPLDIIEYRKILMLSAIFIKNCAENIDNEPWNQIPSVYDGLLVGFFGHPIGGSDKYININITKYIGSDDYKVDTNVFQNISDWFTLIANGLAQQYGVDKEKRDAYYSQHEDIKKTIRDTFYSKHSDRYYEHHELNDYDLIDIENKFINESLKDFLSKFDNKHTIPKNDNKSIYQPKDLFKYIPNKNNNENDLYELFGSFIRQKYIGIEKQIMSKVYDTVKQHKLPGVAHTNLSHDNYDQEDKFWGDYSTTQLFAPYTDPDDYNYNQNIIFNGITGESIAEISKMTSDGIRQFFIDHNIPSNIVNDVSDIAKWNRIDFGSLAWDILEKHSYPIMIENVKFPNVKLSLISDDTSWDGLLGVSVNFLDIQRVIDEFNAQYSSNGRVILNNNFYEKSSDFDELDKPESDNTARDVLLDIDRELTSKQQETKKTMQAAIQTGKTFVKPAKRAIDWINNIINQWRDNSETRLKEKILDNKQRNDLYDGIKSAIKYGSLAKAQLLFNPLFLFLMLTKKNQENKNIKRIRNEIIGEIKTEREIIKEKIEHASRSGDTKAQYALMRTDNELNKRLIRVTGRKYTARML